MSTGAADSLIDERKLTDAVASGFAAAIGAALAFLGNTAPNPPVGCAILDAQGRLLATGGHERAGLPHAEAAALNALRESGRWDDARTLVVTLEPCNHRGRTGPCTEAILRSPVREVWIGCPDPNPNVSGHGAARLAKAGLAVRTLDGDGPIARRCAALIAPFRRLAVERKPWITVKQAIDRHGSMLPPAGQSTFTSERSLLLAHRLRRATDAIVTGTGTVLADRPGFDVRRLPDHPGRRRLLVVVGNRTLPSDWMEAAAGRFVLRRVPGPDLVPAVLAEAGAMWAMAEAGPSLLASLEEAGLWNDRLVITRGAEGEPDRLAIDVADARAASPLPLLPELSRCLEEGACSLGS
ncbi:bifunctional diaminohydroxyphosphoribosylaminopyrimidine deaminase/5-amino-6-(5-phosphoribosylamino)uracil reductase RibD [Acetobacteraceae bacterium KSS8]|uniref:Riboflavin biosynthesis protein RibD n=1 Tax=Endosaccharibacter trunci TaxID=2812733 RepID=A0ABT1W5U0_9PROT|nr:bifunctional diaminohydroxyphosphoribosylaminopyrimidine deaminase/5-amino-6-(5-phosphoribosylamino)uracil reductase RibD [Acetobacteraceae bacterium KSS8]